MKRKIGIVFILLCGWLGLMSLAGASAAVPMEMRIDPELKEDYKTHEPIALENGGFLEIRKEYNEAIKDPKLPKDSSVKVYNVKIKNADGKEDMRLRIYEPKVKKGAGIYWIHGGGTLFGNPEVDEAQNLRFAKEVGAVVVSVDYRLAPENPYPAPAEDCYVGLKWFKENAKRLGVDEKRIAVAGASAGGGLCAAVTLMARDRKGPHIAFQMPLYPMIDDRVKTPSRKEDFGNRVWNPNASLFAWKAYRGKLDPKKIPSYMAPARETNLKNLPPAYSCVGELDIFRDDVIDYMARLAQAGVPTEFHLYPGAYHAFEVTAKDTKYSKRVMDEYVYVLNKALNGLPKK